jgi:DNA modification methylase
VSVQPDELALDQIYCGDARTLLRRVRPDSVALSFWSPPYFVGKPYEQDLSYDAWCDLLRTVIQSHYPAVAPGGFLAINIADILCFPDATMPRLQADTVRQKRSRVTREDVLAAQRRFPAYNRYQLAAYLGCSEQTVDRRLKHNNIRGGKYAAQTRVKLVGGLIEQWGSEAGFYLYDRRIWAKDPAWENSRWHSTSYRAVDEFEYVYIFWKPGITRVDRSRLHAQEWKDWGSRAVWYLPSVRANDDHPAKFPVQLAERVIRLLSDEGDTVLDPFAGSGTTAVAALQTGRHYLGFDLVPEYVALAKSRCAGVTDPVVIRFLTASAR